MSGMEFKSFQIANFLPDINVVGAGEVILLIAGRVFPNVTRQN
jgi:hypothetical protein